MNLKTSPKIRGNPKENYREILNEIAQIKSSNTLIVFNDFCRIASCALALKTREKEYHECIKKYNKEEMDKMVLAFSCFLKEATSKPFEDILGTYYMSLINHSKSSRGEVYTPHHICELMAQLSVDMNKVIEEGKPISVCEPCCGSGGMVLALAKQFAYKNALNLLHATCWDISPLACDMTYINTSIWGICAEINRGDFLEKKVNISYKNIHWISAKDDKGKK